MKTINYITWSGDIILVKNKLEAENLLQSRNSQTDVKADLARAGFNGSFHERINISLCRNILIGKND